MCRILANFPHEISTVSIKSSTQTKAPADAPKRQSTMLTIAQNDILLDMQKKGKNNAAVGCHYEIKESSFRYTKKEECTKFLILRVVRQEKNVRKS